MAKKSKKAAKTMNLGFAEPTFPVKGKGKKPKHKEFKKAY